MAFGNTITKLSELIADSVVGAVIATAADGIRWVLSSPTNSNQLTGYTGDPLEILPGLLQVALTNFLGNTSLNVALRAPSYTSEGAFLSMYSLLATLENHADLIADQIAIRSDINALLATAGVELDGAAGTVKVTGDTTFTDDVTIDGGETVLGGVGISGGLIVALNAAIHGAVGLAVDHALTVGDSLTLNGKTIRAIDFGTWSGTTDASGQIAGTHSLGIKPVYTNLNQSGGSGSGRPRVLSTTTTGFVVQMNNTTTGAAFAAGSAFSGQYFSIA